jgi:hypothetical protein
VFISQHLLENYPATDVVSLPQRLPPVRPMASSCLCSVPCTWHLFNRLNKPEVQSESHGTNLRSINSHLPKQPTISIVLQPTKATTLDLQLVPASTTNRANTLDNKMIVELQTTGVGSTGVHVPSPTTTNRKVPKLEEIRMLVHRGRQHQEQPSYKSGRLQGLQPHLMQRATLLGRGCNAMQRATIAGRVCT